MAGQPHIIGDIIEGAVQGPSFKEGRRDSPHSKVMRLFEKYFSCPD
jgi:hypothetical protein